MAAIHLYKKHPDYTTIPNNFIEHYMPGANGEFVKVYLCLLHYIQGPDTECSVTALADLLNHTENDILRAIRYWEKQGLLVLTTSPQGEITGLSLTDGDHASEETALSGASAFYTGSDAQRISAPTALPSAALSSTALPAAVPSAASIAPSVPASATAQTASNDSAPASAAVPAAAPAERKPRNYTADEITAFSKDPAVEELFCVVSTFTSKQLTPTDMNTVLFWYDDLKFSSALIEYLVEYCITKGHSSLHYMNKVALGWADEGIREVEQAKESSASHNQVYYGVIKALGIVGRNLVPAENNYIAKWTGKYGFSPEMIQEACARTISQINQPSFKYVDGILSKWYKQCIFTLEDAKRDDEQFARQREAAGAQSSTAAGGSAKKSGSAKTSGTKFNNFDQRSYDDAELERLLLNAGFNGDNSYGNQ